MKTIATLKRITEAAREFRFIRDNLVEILETFVVLEEEECQCIRFSHNCFVNEPPVFTFSFDKNDCEYTIWNREGIWTYESDNDENDEDIELKFDQLKNLLKQ